MRSRQGTSRSSSARFGLRAFLGPLAAELLCRHRMPTEAGDHARTGSDRSSILESAARCLPGPWRWVCRDHACDPSGGSRCRGIVGGWKYVFGPGSVAVLTVRERVQRFYRIRRSNRNHSYRSQYTRGASMSIFRAGIVLALATAGLMMGCSRSAEDKMKNEPVTFGTMPDGKSVSLYTLRNAAGMEAKITNYGGIIVSLACAGPEREVRRCCARLRFAVVVSEGDPVLWCADRAVWEPDRQGSVHAGRKGVSADGQ